MQKWEYCLLTGLYVSPSSNFDGSSPRFRIFRPGGMDSTDLREEARKEKVSEAQYLSTYIARLGEEGWEMVGMVQEHLGHHIYFRRPLE